MASLLTIDVMNLLVSQSVGHMLPGFCFHLHHLMHT